MRWLGALAGIMLLLLTLFLGLFRLEEAQSSGLIAFVSDRDGNEDIYLMLADGTRERPLIQHPAYDWYPAWSPDGRQLAFVSDRNGTHDLFVYDLGSRQTRQLTDYNGIERYPAWSPDGKFIYFVTDKDGSYTQLYRINLASQALEWITSIEGGDIWSPHVSRDGRQIVFTARTPAYRNHLFSWDLRTQKLSYLSSENWDYFFPQWSPDGQKVLFNSFGQSANDDIYVLGPAGLQQLTRDSAEDRMPVWSPDGQSIAFMSRRAVSWDIFRMRADGSEVQALTHHRASDWSPAWSPALNLPWAWGWNLALGLFLVILAFRRRR